MMNTMTGRESLKTGSPRQRVFRGRIIQAPDWETLQHYPDGALWVDADGRIQACRHWQGLSGLPDDVEVIELPVGHVILPGLVDMHVHLPQMAITGCQAPDLLTWLDQIVFAEEAKFADGAYARRISEWFFRELLRNGTTTAAVFLTVHPEACNIAFEVAERCGNRVIMGQNLMELNAPEALLRPATQLLAETEALCKRWHGRGEGRLRYAWMPRFALSCSEALLNGIGELRHKYPDVYLHTHLSEQPSEIEAVLQQFPNARSYTEVYERSGLLAARTILAHGIYLSDEELDTLREAGCGLAHCPSSNFFLKSGRFRLTNVLRKAVPFGLGSDVGAGPALSMLTVMRDMQFRQDPVSALLYSATLGAAKALHLEKQIGSLVPGKEADFIIVNPFARRGFGVPPVSEALTIDPTNLLSRLVYLGDEQMIAATYIRGRRVH